MSNGLHSESDYPYNERNQTCLAKQKKIQAKASAVYQIPYQNIPTKFVEENMRTHILQKGVLLVHVDASQWSTYKSGILSTCSPNISLNHAVQLVGYFQSKNGRPAYW